jgi:hypothetical protein
MADDERDPQVTSWLEVEPLDELTRRRLVTTALREADTDVPARRPSRAWRWVAAAAAVVVVGAGTLAIVTAKGGHDDRQTAAPVRTPAAEGSAAPKALSAVPNVGDFGDLGDPANVARARRALDASVASGSAVANDSPRAQASAGAQSSVGAQPVPNTAETCGTSLPAGNVLAQASGTVDGRAAVVVLVERSNGSRDLFEVLSTPCEVRPLGTG